jgi:enamine deaminase RidA (YjgF/YER057c/UK114 family)
MRSRRASFASAVWHGKVYVCGGQTALTQGSEVDEASSTWQVRAPMPPRVLDVR